MKPKDEISIVPMPVFIGSGPSSQTWLSGMLKVMNIKNLVT
jgi:hypothetical protein